MVNTIHSAALLGLNAQHVLVEVDVSGSWPGFQIVGLADTAIQEAKERIRSAWKNTGLSFPSSQRIIINLAPADVKKIGTAYDLPMALGMVACTNSRAAVPDDALVIGELALDGSVRSVHGVLSLATYAKAHGYTQLFVPKDNASEAALIPGLSVFPVPTLRALIDHLCEDARLAPLPHQHIQDAASSAYAGTDFASVVGQSFAKRALEIAAAGGHNVLMSGPPGSGKTMLSRALPSILPPLSYEEMIEVTSIYSVRGLLSKDRPYMIGRPFRAPHHSASAASLIGGGPYPRPGEITLAHHGVLFLDELPEFARPVLEHLRQPLEDGIVSVARAHGTVQFPARIMLVASQNPCPCGFATDENRACQCSAADIVRYQRKISGPLLDRFDLHISVPRVPVDALSQKGEEEPSSGIRARVCAARQRQAARFIGAPHHTNATLSTEELQKWCALPDDALFLLRQAAESLHLSMRGYTRVLKVARTIADLAGADAIAQAHVAEALQYRMS